MSFLYPVEGSLHQTTRLHFGDIVDDEVILKDKVLPYDPSGELDKIDYLPIHPKYIENGSPSLFIFGSQTETMLFAGPKSVNVQWRFATDKRFATFLKWALTDTGLYLYQNINCIEPADLPEKYDDTINNASRMSKEGLVRLCSYGFSKFIKL